VVRNIPVACKRASADYMISSPLLSSAYERQMPSYDGLQGRLSEAKVAADAAGATLARTG
jgi:methylglyoxal synthase